MIKLGLSFLILITMIGIIILVSFYNSYDWPNDVCGFKYIFNFILYISNFSLIFN